MQKSTIQLCRKGTKKKVKDHEKSDYYCLNHMVYNRHLQLAAEIGCDFTNKREDNFYPASYEGPSFSKKGPYLTYPIVKDAGPIKRI